MNEIDQLAQKIASHITPAIPINVDMWDVETIAKFLKRSPQVVRERIVCLPSFPPSIRIPTIGSAKSRPLWEAKDVIAWAKGFKQKH